MRRAHLACTLGLALALGAPAAQAQHMPNSAALAGPAIPIPITMRADVPVLNGTHLSCRSFTKTWLHVYRPLPYPGLPTELVVSRVRDQVVAQPKPQP